MVLHDVFEIQAMLSPIEFIILHNQVDEAGVLLDAADDVLEVFLQAVV
jgi:hypothetical protein